MLFKHPHALQSISFSMLPTEPLKLFGLQGEFLDFHDHQELHLG
jgi:hypothetical protein